MIKNRPILNIKYYSEGKNSIELFQNEILRPVIKMQHELLMIIFQERIKKLSINWNRLKLNKKVQLVNNQICTNTQFKNFILGTIIGQLNNKELNTYLLDSKEYNKRIIQIIIQRIISTF